MAGPLQTAIGQVLGAVGATALIGKKLSNDERQVREKEAKLAEKAEKEAKKSQKKDSEIVSKTINEAQKKKLASSVIFDKQGKPLATYEELAELLSSQKTSSTLASSLRSMVATQERRKVLMQRKQEKEQVK